MACAITLGCLMRRKKTEDHEPEPEPTVDAVAVGGPAPFNFSKGLTLDEFAATLGKRARGGFIAWARANMPKRQSVAEWREAIKTHGSREVK